MSTQSTIVEISCEEVRSELVSYMEGDLAPELAQRIEQHLAKCRHCVAIYDGARNILSLLGDKAIFQLPEGFSHRLRDKFARHILVVGNSS